MRALPQHGVTAADWRSSLRFGPRAPIVSSADTRPCSALEPHCETRHTQSVSRSHFFQLLQIVTGLRSGCVRLPYRNNLAVCENDTVDAVGGMRHGACGVKIGAFGQPIHVPAEPTASWLRPMMGSCGAGARQRGGRDHSASVRASRDARKRMKISRPPRRQEISTEEVRGT